MSSGAPAELEHTGFNRPTFVSDPIGLVERRWKWMLGVLLVALTLTGLVVRMMGSSYLGYATVLVTSQRISEEFFRPTVESDQLEKVSAILGELTSRQNLVELIEKHGLYPDKPGEESLSLEEKVALIRRDTVIEPDTSTGAARPGSAAVVYGISFRVDDPAIAAAVANDLAADFIDTHLRMRSRQARLTTEFLRRELKQVETDLAEQERAITAFKQQYRGELPGELETNLSRLDRLQAQRQSLALQIAETETRLATLQSSAQPGAETPETRLRALKSRLADLSAIYTPEHPSIASIQRQITTLEAEIASAPAGGPAASPASTLAELRRQLAATAAEFENLDVRVAATPKRQEELAALEQRAEILRENHREFLRKVSQAELAEAVESAQQGERATILDKAVPPREPENSPLKYILAGIFGSVLLSLAIGVLLEIVDAVIVGAEEIERDFQVPVLGSVARIR
jgi:polysaccharide biosynthesis transport protein